MMDKAPDLADLVQQLRMLIWRTGAPLRDMLGKEGWRQLAEVEWRDPHTLAAVGKHLHVRSPDLAAEWSFLAGAFAASPSPRMPDDDELLRRYVKGEIGDRTLRWVRNWDHWQLIDECLARGLPPMQMGED
jgi:hypothetical protein